MSGSRRIPVCIFAKPPVAGAVKTRLIPELGAKAAAALASSMLCDTWHVLASCPGIRPILAAAEEGDFPLNIAAEDFWLQGEGALDVRLERILTRALEIAAVAIAVGADSPLLAPVHIEEALSALETYDAAIGPCADGGFYLLGLKHFPPGLLRDVPWSCCDTFLATMRRLEEHRFSVQTITPLFDVDSAEDLELLGSALAESSATAPHTRAWYKQYRSRCE